MTSLLEVMYNHFTIDMPVMDPPILGCYRNNVVNDQAKELKTQCQESREIDLLVSFLWIVRVVHKSLFNLFSVKWL